MEDDDNTKLFGGGKNPSKVDRKKQILKEIKEYKIKRSLQIDEVTKWLIAEFEKTPLTKLENKLTFKIKDGFIIYFEMFEEMIDFSCDLEDFIKETYFLGYSDLKSIKQSLFNLYFTDVPVINY